MKRDKGYYCYLIKVQYLGFRYHGWQKQQDVKTVQGMIDRTIAFILDHDSFKTLGSSRTDAMVSADCSYFELFSRKEVDADYLLLKLNKHLPPDISVHTIKQVSYQFNIINDVVQKEYRYLFSYGERNHPFCAFIMTNILEELNLAQMKACAHLFEGSHNFQQFCYKPTKSDAFERNIEACYIAENNEIQANFFPENSYLFVVRGKGFMRHQVRLMMGAVFEVGKGILSLDQIKRSLSHGGEGIIAPMAPASGLMLKDVQY